MIFSNKDSSLGEMLSWRSFASVFTGEKMAMKEGV